MLGLLLAAAIAAPSPQTIHYNIVCRISPQDGNMKLNVLARVPASLIQQGRLEFRMAEAMQEPVVTAEPPSQGALSLKHLKTENSMRYWAIEVPARNQEVHLRFEYASTAKLGFVFYLGPEACYAGGYNTLWYPRFGEMRGTGRIEIVAPDGFVAKATGKGLEPIKSEGQTRWPFVVEQPSVFTFAAAPYKVTHIPGRLPVTVYSLRERSNAKEYAEGCWRILQVLESHFGKYPYPDFSIIETPTKQSQEGGFSGASFEGFMFASSSSMDRPFNNAYFGHEMGHQWWGNYVQQVGDAGNYMLDEAMAQYASLQVVEALEGPGKAARYRWKGYPGYSSMQCGYYAILYGPSGLDLPLSKTPPAYDHVYHNLANAKGFLVMDTIARHVGRLRFTRALRSFIAEHAWGTATFKQFSDVIRALAGSEGERLMDQWFYQSGVPSVWLEHSKTHTAVTGELRQKLPTYLLAMPVIVTYTDGSQGRFVVKTGSQRQPFTIRGKKQVSAVELDPNHEVLHSTPAMDEEAQALRFWTRAQLEGLRGRMHELRKAYEEGKGKWPDPDPYGAEFSIRMGLAGVLRREGKMREAKEEYERALLCATRRAEDLPWAYLRLAMVCRATGDQERMKWAIGQMQSAEALLDAPSEALDEARRERLID